MNVRVAFKWSRQYDFVFFFVEVDFVNTEVNKFEFKFFKINTFGEEAFLNKLRQLL